MGLPHHWPGNDWDWFGSWIVYLGLVKKASEVNA
jgi:hypothetical protein